MRARPRILSYISGFLGFSPTASVGFMSDAAPRLRLRSSPNVLFPRHHTGSACGTATSPLHLLRQRLTAQDAIRRAHGPDLAHVCEHCFGPPRQSETSHRVYTTPWHGNPRVNIQNDHGLPGQAGAGSDRTTRGGTATGHYGFRVHWSTEDEEFIGTVAEFPSLSWPAADPVEAFDGIRTLVADVVREMREAGEQPPTYFGERSFSGKFMVRIPASLHRELALEAAERGISLNRVVSHRLAHA